MSMLLGIGFQAVAHDVNKATPLWWAAQAGQTKVVELLLSQISVHVNNVNSKTRTTALGAASGRGHVDVVKLLLEYEGIDVNSSSCEKRTLTPLMTAITNRRRAIVEILLARKDIEADKSNEKGGTPLMLAVHTKDEDILQQLLRRGDVDVNAVDHGGSTALFRTLDWYHAGVMILLLERTDLVQKDNRGQPRPLRAARQGRVELVERLVTHPNIEVNGRDTGGVTILSEAAEKGWNEVLNKVLSHEGVEVDVRNSREKTPLMQAAARGREEVVGCLSNHGADANAADDNGRTALSLAAKYGYEGLEPLPVACDNISVDWRKAADAGRKAVVVRLLASGADVNAATNMGETALSEAASCGHAEVVTALLACGNISIYTKCESSQPPGVDVNAKNKDGNTALELALFNGHTKVIEILLAHAILTLIQQMHMVQRYWGTLREWANQPHCSSYYLTMA